MSEQFPALDGDVKTEIAQRSPDGSKGSNYLKVFVVTGEVAPTDPMHFDNKLAVLDEAIRLGLHPKGDVKLAAIAVEGVGRRAISRITYGVIVTPASVDANTPTTVTPRAVLLDEDTDDEEAPAPQRKKTTKSSKAAE